MPTSYLTAAELELTTRANTYLAKYNSPLEKYDISIDERYLRKNSISLYVGDKIFIVDAQMGINSQLRIYSIKQSIVNQYSYQIELTDELQTSRLIDLTNNQYSIERALKELTKNLRILKNN